MKIFPRNVLLLAVAAGLGFVTFTAEPATTPARAVGPLLRDYDAASVDQLALMGERATTTLRRTATGWAVEELWGAPANASVVANLLQKVGGITDLDLLTDATTPLDQVVERYGLSEEESLRVRAVDASGSTRGDLLIERAPGPGYPAFVREVGSSVVVRTPSFFQVPTEPSAWFAKAPLVRGQGSTIKELDLLGEALVPGLQLRVPDGLSAEWERAGGERVSARAVERLVDGLHIVPSSVAGPAPASVEGAPLRIRVLPLVGDEVVLHVLETGDAAAGAPGKIFREGAPVVYGVDPSRIADVLDLARALASDRD